jgi:hypothetical protein
MERDMPMFEGVDAGNGRKNGNAAAGRKLRKHENVCGALTPARRYVK